MVRKANKLGLVEGISMDLFAANIYTVDHGADPIALRAAKKDAGEHPAFWRVGSSAVRPFAGDPLPLP
jgi:hypothetical protein